MKPTLLAAAVVSSLCGSVVQAESPAPAPTVGVINNLATALHESIGIKMADEGDPDRLALLDFMVTTAR